MSACTGACAAQLTPTREQIARELYRASWGDMLTWEDDNKLFYDYADAVLALLQAKLISL